MLLKPVDHVEILSIMDNSLDLLMSSVSGATRAPIFQDSLSLPQLRAEHGVSMLITVYVNGRRDSFLFDTGISVDGALHNLDVLEIRPTELHAVVLSHGHTDHTGGLSGLLKRYGRRKLPIILHPDALLKRKNIRVNGEEVYLPPPNRQDMEAEGVDVIEERGPTLLIQEYALITGEIDRVTSFENGFPYGYSEIDGQWESDPWIHDDQATVINVLGKGLVVLTGCGHAGLINTIYHAMKVTGVRDIYAIIGGFHLSGPIFEPIIAPTIQALKEINPRVIAPQHCTGWRATLEIAREFPDAFIANSVGTQFLF